MDKKTRFKRLIAAFICMALAISFIPARSFAIPDSKGTVKITVYTLPTTKYKSAKKVVKVKVK